jgi:hypothetical protein
MTIVGFSNFRSNISAIWVNFNSGSAASSIFADKTAASLQNMLFAIKYGKASDKRTFLFFPQMI